MHDSRLSRRDVLKNAAAGSLWLPVAQSMLAADALAQKTAKPQAGMLPLNRFPRMVHEWFVKQVREVEHKGLKRKNALKTKADALAYVKDVRKRIMQSFGPFPEKTPLNPRVTRVVKRDGYNIENIIFESRPGFLVTANLYVPSGSVSDRSLPGVVGTCGHSTNGKAAGAYQSFSQGLAKQGYVVLIYDPIGQGERLQYPDEHLKSKVGVGVREHLHAGNQQFLVGEFLGSWRAWDGIRALDYLLTRKEVDPRKVGVTGNSGGGTMTTWLCGVEQRWSMAAPSCFVTTFRRNMENELPADTEQCPPQALALGLDHDDFIAAMAPKPVILLAKEKDFFDVRGTQEAYARLKRLYKLLGAEENIGLFVGPTYHGYSQENREAMYGWFNKATKPKASRTLEASGTLRTKEPAIKLEKDETLWCAPKGQVSELKSKTVFSFTEEAARNLERVRSRLSASKLKAALSKSLKLDTNSSTGVVLKDALRNHRGKEIVVAVDANGRVFLTPDRSVDLKEFSVLLARLAPEDRRRGLFILFDERLQLVSSTRLMNVLRKAKLTFKSRMIRERGDSPEYRIIRHRGRSRKYPAKYHITYAVETEPGIHAVVTRLSDERLYSRPPRGKKRAVLYVSHQSADAELRDESLIKAVLKDEPDAAYFAIDVRGIGESRPGTAGADPYTNPYGADYFYAIHSLMLDKPYVGRRTHDVLRTLDWLRGIGHTEVHLVAKGWGALPATFASVLSNQVKQVTLKNALTSFHALATTEHYDWPLSSFVPNVLESYDLPDCYAELKAKKLKQIEPRGAKRS